jgi:uroporphyrinogen-III synthase
MRILLTRPPEEALRTAEKLAAHGHQIVSSPVLEMQPRDAAWPSGAIDGVIATSAQAFEHAQFAPEYPLPEARRLLRLFVVGSRTGEAARRCGFTGELTSAPDAKDLAEAIINTMHPPARLAYLAGHDRKSDLEMRCDAAHLEITTVEIYEARAAEALSVEAIAALAGGKIDAVLHFSRRSAEIFLRLAQTAGLDPKSVRHMAISADAAAPLHAAGFLHVMIAAEPNERAILALLSPKPAATPSNEVPREPARRAASKVASGPAPQPAIELAIGPAIELASSPASDRANDPAIEPPSELLDALLSAFESELANEFAVIGPASSQASDPANEPPSELLNALLSDFESELANEFARQSPMKPASEPPSESS